MQVCKLMSANVVTVELDDPLWKVKAIFEKTGFHNLLVVEHNRLYGVLSDRDLLKTLSPNVDSKHASPKDLACLNKKAHQVMTRKPIFLFETDRVKQAIESFTENRISCIPIVNAKEEPVGILSWRDIMRALISQQK